MRQRCIHIIFVCTFLFAICDCKAQEDSVVHTLSEIPVKYFKEVDKKMDKYSDRLTRKTEKTLTKLSKWEKKIEKLLRKVNPAAANRLFNANALTFSSMLTKLSEGKSIAQNERKRFDSYRDKLSTSIKYLDDKKEVLDSQYIKPLKKVSEKSKQLEEDIANTEAVEKFIKERKKQLLDESLKHLGKSKYLQKINKESYYYVETLRNYKTLFSDPKKAEETAMKLMHSIPGFDNFVKKNGMLSQLFGSAGGYTPGVPLAGLQTRDAINELVQNKIAAGGPNAQALLQQQLKVAQGQMNKLKSEVQKISGNSSNVQIPDFKPNSQKSKTFLQRLEFGSNLQFGKTNKWVPNAANIGLSVGYKLNDKSTVGLGLSYKLGMGSIERIKFSHEGLGLRSFIDWKLKKQFFLSGGFEMNYNASIRKIAQLQNMQFWQQSGLIGITKKYKIGLKKKGYIQLMFDFLYNNHLPISQPIVYRIGFIN